LLREAQRYASVINCATNIFVAMMDVAILHLDCKKQKNGKRMVPILEQAYGALHKYNYKQEYYSHNIGC
jgi:hypothetical protein